MRSLTWEMDVQEEGRNKFLTELINKKLAKGKTTEQIAEELEMDIEEIKDILSN